MRDREAVLFANDAFYAAFAAGDFDAMAALWSEDATVSCIHPGWQALFGRAAVIDSWRAILAEGAPPDIRCRAPRPSVQGDRAHVVCYEQIGGGLLVATNLFRREGSGWKLLHHQAGPCPLKPEALGETEAAPSVQ